jgi:hypothetical protein
MPERNIEIPDQAMINRKVAVPEPALDMPAPLLQRQLPGAQLTLRDLYRGSLGLVQARHDFRRDAHDHFELVKLSTAYHEAGHAIACHHHGCKVDLTYSLGVRFGNFSYIWAQNIARGSAFRQLTRDAKFNCYMAGVAAEVLAFNLLLNNPQAYEAITVRRRTAINVQDDMLKVVRLHINSTSTDDIKAFYRDEDGFLDLFEEQASRAMDLLVPYKALLRTFAIRLVQQSFIVRPSTFLESIVAEK